MYTNLKSIQFLVAALKAYSVKKVVISPGNSHNAIVRSLEEDEYFTTYSIVDERSAAFFACGLAQELKEPIAICCTAGTAATNYMSAVTEAYRRTLPLVVITGDKNQYYLAQNEDQMTDCISIFKSITKRDCILPIIENKTDEWYCQRVLNDTLLEMNHHGAGPVHIDVPIEAGLSMFAIRETFTTESLPAFHKIDRYDLSEDEDLSELFKSIIHKKIFVLCGQDDHISDKEIELLEKIFAGYNCVFGTDKLSNLHCSGTVDITRAKQSMLYKLDAFWPDVVISIGGNPVMDYKFKFKTDRPLIHWDVNESGRLADPFKKLKCIFEGTTEQFLEKMASYGDANVSHAYYEKWKKAYDEFVFPEFEYSNLYALQKLMCAMPEKSNFNIGNSTIIRLACFFDLDDSIQVYCNRGVNGIDGCVSTYIGQAAASPDTLNFLAVGDLTFFYDMNSLWNHHVGNNVRIMLSNNEGAALFHFNQGTHNYPQLNQNVAAEHFTSAKGWVESLGFKYLSCHNKDEFDAALDEFTVKTSDKPIFFEVFTQKEKDAEIQHKFYESVIRKDKKEAARDNAKKIIKSIIGDDMVRKIRGK